MRIVFIGPPGAGKGTQCKRVSLACGVPHISSGEMLRANRGKTDLGRLISGFIDGGNLAPDDLVMKLMTERLAQPDCEKGYLLDGFPRTVVQARRLDDFLAANQQKIDRVIQLVADEPVLVDRLVKRAKVENRVDDTPETIAARLKVYRRQTEPVLGYYQQHGIVCPIDAMRPPDLVHADICGVLNP